MQTKKLIVIAALMARTAHAGIITEELVDAQIERESAGNPSAIGLAGEVGLGQIKDVVVLDLVREYGWKITTADRFCPKKNRAMTRGFLVLTERRLAQALRRQPTRREIEGAYRMGLEGFLRAAYRTSTKTRKAA